MPPPVLPCGKEHQPPCPPEPGAVAPPSDAVVEERYTFEEMHAHGQACFDAGRDYQQRYVEENGIAPPGV